MNDVTEHRRRIVMLLGFIAGDQKVYCRVKTIWKDHNKYLRRRKRHA
jgi:hypothetical protein